MRQKVFCVGLHKAGTSSLHNFFQSMGLKSTHSTSWSRAPLSSHCLESYEAFSDGGAHFWDDDLEFGGNHELRQLRDLYPRSRFILQYRDMKPWIVSKMLHAGWRFETTLDERSGSFVHDEWRTKSLSVLRQWIENRVRYHRVALDFLSHLPQSEFMVIDVTAGQTAARSVAEFVLSPRRPIFLNGKPRHIRWANRLGRGAFFAPSDFPRENKSRANPKDRKRCEELVSETLTDLSGVIDSDADLLRRSSYS